MVVNKSLGRERRRTDRESPSRRSQVQHWDYSLCQTPRALAAEIKELGSGEDAAKWVHQNLSAKNRLRASDATQVEALFAARLAKVATSSVQEPQERMPARASLLQAPNRSGIDKSELSLPEPRRVRDREHVRSVAQKPCLVCGRCPSDPHHLRFAQSRALSRKVSDEFVVPLCRGHHREVHRCGDETAWWRHRGIMRSV